MSQESLELARALYLSGNHAGAMKAYAQALAEGEPASESYLGMGLIDMECGRTASAIAHLKSAIAADPNNENTLTALGAAFIQDGSYAKATTILAEAVKRAPNNLETRHQLARAFAELKRFEDALHVLSKTVSAFPDSTESWRRKGNIEHRSNLLKEAYESLGRAAELNPDDAAVLNDWGVICRALGHYAEAETLYRRSLSHNPRLAVAHANLGNTLELLERVEEAEQSMRTALNLDPATPDTAYNLAAVLMKLEKPSEALLLLEPFVEEHPHRWDGWTNLGIARMDTGDLAGAEVALRQSITLKPSNPEAHYSLAWLLLLSDRHEEGWVELEWRWQLPDFASSAPPADSPTWSGAPLNNQSLLIHAEQGLGDAIQFARFITDIPRQDGTIILQCHAPVVPLLSGLDGIDTTVALGEITPPCDLQVPLMSLPNLLGYDGERTRHSAGYLKPTEPVPPRLNVPENDRKKIGLVWAGAPENRIDRRRRIDIDLFLPIFDATEADFIGLQVGPQSASANIFPLNRMTFSCDGVVNDFQDTATVVGQLDLVIGVDTSVIHLSGALGIPTWILLPFMPDYRWGLGRPTSAWYDSVRLFRQPQQGDWGAAISDICNALRSW